MNDKEIQEVRSLKDVLNKKFEHQKRSFGVHDKLDPYIKDFILGLNKSKNIVTVYSCEGMSYPGDHHSWSPYFGFNISERKWNVFWDKLLPELMRKQKIKISAYFYSWSKTWIQ